MQLSKTFKSIPKANFKKAKKKLSQKTKKHHKKS